MDRLPLEVFTKITSYLRCSEKLQLLRVCQYWHNAIKSTNLYNDFAVKGNLRFQQCLTLFQQQPHTQQQVKRIQLIKPEMDASTILSLPSQFLHLEELVFEDYSNSDYRDLPLPINMDELLIHWAKLKSITETNRHLYMPMLLQSSVQFINLTHLVINSHFPSSNIASTIIPHLDHAPALTWFELCHVSLDLEQLEILHEKAPQLEILYLTDIAHRSNDEFRFGEGMQPAIKLTTLRIERISIAGVINGIGATWLYYISQKYKNMMDFSIGGVGMGINILITKLDLN
jgi:hypothetical protein